MDYKEVTKKYLQIIDLIIGCDICYWEDHVTNIIELTKQRLSVLC